MHALTRVTNGLAYECERASRFCYILYKSFFRVRHRKQAYYSLSLQFIASRFSDLAWFPESGVADEWGLQGGP